MATLYVQFFFVLWTLSTHNIAVWTLFHEILKQNKRYLKLYSLNSGEFNKIFISISKSVGKAISIIQARVKDIKTN